MSALRHLLRRFAGAFSPAQHIRAVPIYPVPICPADPRQSDRLIQAKSYLRERGIDAMQIGSKFHYERATGSVLRPQS